MVTIYTEEIFKLIFSHENFCFSIKISQKFIYENPKVSK